MVVRRPTLRSALGSWALPFVAFVLITVAVVGYFDSRQNHADTKRQRDFVALVARIEAKATQGRQALCDFVNRLSDGAKLDRQFLVVLSTRPGLPVDPTRDRIIRAYLDFGPLAYPRLNCPDIVAGGEPPSLPPLPPSPLGAAAAGSGGD
jgi:hypothetical protein